MRYFIFLFALLFASSGHSNTHCTQDEKTYFSCPAHGKTISVCGSNNIKGESAYIQYRFGVIGKVELAYPNDKNNSFNKFSKHFYSGSSGTWQKTLTFSNGLYKYAIFQGATLPTGDFFGGVAVTQDSADICSIEDSTKLFIVNCDSDSEKRSRSQIRLVIPESIPENDSSCFF